MSETCGKVGSNFSAFLFFFTWFYLRSAPIFQHFRLYANYFCSSLYSCLFCFILQTLLSSSAGQSYQSKKMLQHDQPKGCREQVRHWKCLLVSFSVCLVAWTVSAVNCQLLQCKWQTGNVSLPFRCLYNNTIKNIKLLTYFEKEMLPTGQVGRE